MSAIAYWGNITTPTQMLKLANDVSGGWFWFFMTLALFIILFIVLLNFGYERATLTASLSTLIMSVMLAYMDLLNWKFVLMYFGILIFMMLYVYYSSTRENI